jgi:hypothetical protein
VGARYRHREIFRFDLHSYLRDFLDQRVTDGVIRRMIDKWLKAGVLEDGLLRHAIEGSPQGGVISPCLSNIFLHHVLDEWFEFEVRPRLKGRCTLVRFADDAVMAFEKSSMPSGFLGVLGKRLARYGLTLHPDKTRFVDFRNTRADGKTHPETDGTAFTFLGFTLIWGKSRGRARMWLPRLIPHKRPLTMTFTTAAFGRSSSWLFEASPYRAAPPRITNAMQLAPSSPMRRLVSCANQFPGTVIRSPTIFASSTQGNFGL